MGDMQSQNGHTGDSLSESTEIVPVEIVRVDRAAKIARSRHSGSGNGARDQSRVVKDTLSLLDLALARCRSDGTSAGPLKDSIREVLQSTREEITELEARGRNREPEPKSLGPAESFIRNRLLPFGNRDRHAPGRESS